MEEQSIPGADEGAENAAQVEGLARQVNGENVHFSDGLAFNVTANQTMTMTDAAAMVVGVGGDMVMSDGGAMIVGVGHDLKLTDGGALSMQVIVVPTDADPDAKDYLDKARIFESDQVYEPK